MPTLDQALAQERLASKSQAKRIAELEAILQTTRGRDSSNLKQAQQRIAELRLALPWDGCPARQ